MKPHLASLSRQYQAALLKHLQGRESCAATANWLARRAIALRVATLDLARIHEGAVAGLPSARGTDRAARRLKNFFNEVNARMLDKQGRDGHSVADLHRLKTALIRRTTQLAAANRELELGIVRRRKVEAALKKSERHDSRLLAASLHIQQGLRKLTHKLLRAQEGKRKVTSAKLRDDVAQSLLGVNVHLFSLKKQASAKSRRIASEIASTQRLVSRSKTSIRRAARSDITA